MRPTAVAAVLLTVVALGGCAEEPLPDPQPQEAAAALPVLAESQLDLVMQGNIDEIIQALVSHDQAEKMKAEAIAA